METGNVFMSNLAYEVGEVVYSFYLVTLALFLLVYDLERLVNLLVLHKPTFPAHTKRLFSTQTQNIQRIVLKTFFILVFVVFNAYSLRQLAANGGYHAAQQPGLSSLQGLYQVREFRFNGQSPLSTAGAPDRWENVVFEKWLTLSIKTPRPSTLQNHAVEYIPKDSSDATGPSAQRWEK